MHIFTTYLFLLTIALSGCAIAPSHPQDVRAALLDSAKTSEPDFPDGHEVLLTHFAYIGNLMTTRGDIVYVVDQNGVIADMESPHGLNYIVFFDRQFRYLGKISYVTSCPLWCDGSRLYLSGDLDGFAEPPSLSTPSSRGDTPEPGFDIPPGGNVIDVAGGYGNIRSYHAHIYGSSGGIDD